MSLKAAVAGIVMLAILPAWTNAPEQWEVIENYCYQCHNDEDWAGSIAFNLMSVDEISHDAEIWEEAIRRIEGGICSPPATTVLGPVGDKSTVGLA